MNGIRYISRGIFLMIPQTIFSSSTSNINSESGGIVRTVKGDNSKKDMKNKHKEVTF